MVRVSFSSTRCPTARGPTTSSATGRVGRWPLWKRNGPRQIPLRHAPRGATTPSSLGFPSCFCPTARRKFSRPGNRRASPEDRGLPFSGRLGAADCGAQDPPRPLDRRHRPKDHRPGLLVADLVADGGNGDRRALERGQPVDLGCPENAVNQARRGEALRREHMEDEPGTRWDSRSKTWCRTSRLSQSDSVLTNERRMARSKARWKTA